MLADLRHLALMNFLLEHFEEIPQELLQKLCFPDESRGRFIDIFEDK
jgi:hypothetical protein